MLRKMKKNASGTKKTSIKMRCKINHSIWQSMMHSFFRDEEATLGNSNVGRQKDAEDNVN